MATGMLLACTSTSRAAEEKTIPPCREDAMIVFDGSGSLSGNETLGIPNSRARIDEARSALAQVPDQAFCLSVISGVVWEMPKRSQGRKQ